MKGHNLRQEQAAETREKLLAAAKTLFAEKGYHATPVRAINRKLKMGDGILYHYFPGGKKEILTVLLQESFESRIVMIQEMNERIEQLPLADFIRQVITRAQGFFMSDKELMRILIRESDVLKLGEMDQLSSIIQQRSCWLTGVLKSRYEKGEIRKMDFSMCALELMSMSMLLNIKDFIGIKLTDETDQKNYREHLIHHLVDSWKNRDE